MRLKTLIIAACMFFATSIAVAAPVVTFTSSGSAGSWLLDFSITNNLGGLNDIYFFGVQAPTANVVAAPSGWNTDNYNSGWNNAPFGGSNTTYLDTWCCTMGGITSGQTLGGFSALYNTIAAPTSVAWFAVAYGDTYAGTDYFNTSTETYAMLLVGLGLLGFTARRKKDTFV
jgi:hypothetical protein